VPPQVHVLLHRCLARDQRQRVKHMSAARLLLEEHEMSVPGTVQEPRIGRSSRMRVWAATIVAAVVAGFAAGAWYQRPGPRPVVRTTLLADVMVTPADRSFAFLPDGRLAYVSSNSRQVLIRRPDVLEPLPIYTTASFIRGTFPSPDGRWIGFIENNFTLMKVRDVGGPAVSVLRIDGPSRGADWGPGDAIVFATGNAATGLQQVPAGGGPATVLTRPDASRGELDHFQPVWLPGGRGVLFTVAFRESGPDRYHVAVLERGSTSWRTLIEGGYGARYVDTGHLVYVAGGTLWSVRFDLAGLSVEGPPIRLGQEVPVTATGAVAHFDIGQDGTLAYLDGTLRDDGDLRLVWVDRAGRETLLSASPGTYRHPRLSPDGRRLAVSLSGDIVVWDFDRPWETMSRMTFAPQMDWAPVWTPDGRRVVFGSWRGGGFSNLYVQDPDGGEAERLTDSADMQLPTSITPDGSTVVFHSFTERLEALRLDGSHGAERQVTLVETPREERNGAIAPDGRWLAYEAESETQPGVLDVYVRPFPDIGRGLWQVTRGGGTFPAWAADGRELFYVTPDGTMMAVPVEAVGATWRTGSPVELFRGAHFRHREGSLGRHYDVTPDGRRFLMLRSAVDARAPHFVMVQNWTAELRRLAAGR
jgi:hypothetical protein